MGTFAAGKSPYGIHDLAGNVWGWVRDWYDATYYSQSPERNSENITASGYRVLRGGGRDGNADNLRAANRIGGAPTNRHVDDGFRCVVEVSAPRK